jgi:hypothetical protein
MIFRYNGGDCSGSFNIQPDTLFICEDYQGGPPTEDGVESYIIASSLDGGDVYFAGFIPVGEEFTALAVGDKFPANMNITIYDPNGSEDATVIVQPSNILQTVIYHSSCSQNLFLKDRFGSVQLVVFVNIDQGTVSCFVNATLSFTIDVPVEIEGDMVELTALTVITNIDNGNGGIYDLSEKVAGTIITKEMPFVIQQKILLDLTVRQKYTALSTIVGRTDEGKTCFGTDFFEFTAGNPLPPIFPTLAPSAAPTISPFPTPDPETSACEVAADITCRTVSGGNCDLQSPAGATCIGSNAESLQFIYIPSSLCNGNNTQDKYKCDDDNLQISPRPQSAFIRVSRRNAIFFEGVRAAGQIFSVGITDADANDVDIEIFTAVNDGQGLLLQESKLSVRCRVQDGLTLLNTFGALQLVGFRNTELGSQQIFANVVLSYIASNAGVLNMDLTDAFRESAFSGFEDLLAGERRLIAPDATEIFLESFTLNLAATAGQSFEFSFLVNGEGSRSLANGKCDDTALFTLNVKAP